MTDVDELAAALRRLEQGPPFTVALKPQEAFALIACLQLAWRHPRLSRGQKQLIEHFAHGLEHAPAPAAVEAHVAGRGRGGAMTATKPWLLAAALLSGCGPPSCCGDAARRCPAVDGLYTGTRRLVSVDATRAGVCPTAGTVEPWTFRAGDFLTPEPPVDALSMHCVRAQDGCRLSIDCGQVTLAFHVRHIYRLQLDGERLRGTWSISGHGEGFCRQIWEVSARRESPDDDGADDAGADDILRPEHHPPHLPPELQ